MRQLVYIANCMGKSPIVIYTTLFAIGDFPIQFSIYTNCRIHHVFWAWGACVTGSSVDRVTCVMIMNYKTSKKWLLKVYVGFFFPGQILRDFEGTNKRNPHGVQLKHNSCRFLHTFSLWWALYEIKTVCSRVLFNVYETLCSTHYVRYMRNQRTWLPSRFLSSLSELCCEFHFLARIGYACVVSKHSYIVKMQTIFFPNKFVESELRKHMPFLANWGHALRRCTTFRALEQGIEFWISVI